MPRLTIVADTPALALLMASAKSSRVSPDGVIVVVVPLTVSVYVAEELILVELGSVTGGDPGLLIVVVDEPTLETWMEYVPGRVVDSAEAVTTEVSEELAETLPVAAVAMPCIALCSESKAEPKLASDDCCDWSVVTSVCSCCMGSEAMETARCKTC